MRSLLIVACECVLSVLVFTVPIASDLLENSELCLRKVVFIFATKHISRPIMAHFKEALSSLAPIPYDDLPSQEALPEFLQSSFAHAEVILNSIPGHASSPSNTDDSAFSPSPTNSAHNAQETFCDPAQVPLPQYETDATAVKGWGKPLKIGVKENPLGVQVYKMAAHDRHGAWFARRSIHQGLGFSKWRKAAQQEFLESLKVQEGPGSGSVRGVGADRRVERMEVDNGTSIDGTFFESEETCKRLPSHFHQIFKSVKSTDTSLRSLADFIRIPGPSHASRELDDGHLIHQRPIHWIKSGREQ